jgi:hypothetical protein
LWYTKGTMTKPDTNRTDGKRGASVYRLSSGDAEALRWFWLVAPGEMGLRAVNIDGAGGGGGDTDPRAIQASERWRRINARLNAMPAGSVRVLQRTYATESVWPGLGAFGPMACIVARSEAAKRLYRAATGAGGAYRDGFERWLRALSARMLGPTKRQQSGDADAVAQICFDCDAMLARACSQYKAASRECRATSVSEKAGRSEAIRREREAWATRKASLDAGDEDGVG